MNRKPIYHVDGQPYRVVSCANGQWQAQSCRNGKSIAETREYDPWEPLHRPTTLEEAKRQMYTACPTQAKIVPTRYASGA